MMGASQGSGLGPSLPASVTWVGGGCGWVTWAPSCLCPPRDQIPYCFGECGDFLGRGCHMGSDHSVSSIIV